MRVDLEDLGLESGGELLLRRALRQLPSGERLQVTGRHAELELQLRAWCRSQAHRFEPSPDASLCGTIIPAPHLDKLPTEVTGGALQADVAERAPRHWGLAGRSAQLELGGPAFDFAIVDKIDCWTDDAARLYARAAAAQWDPESAIDWSTAFENDAEIEEAVVQIMTYLIENETRSVARAGAIPGAHSSAFP